MTRAITTKRRLLRDHIYGGCRLRETAVPKRRKSH